MKGLELSAGTSMLSAMPLSSRNTSLKVIHILVIALLSLASISRSFAAIGDTATELRDLYGEPSFIDDATRRAEWDFINKKGVYARCKLSVYFDDEFLSQFESLNYYTGHGRNEQSFNPEAAKFFVKTQSKRFKGSKYADVAAEPGEKWHWGEFSRTPKIGEVMAFFIKEGGSEDDSILIAFGVKRPEPNDYVQSCVATSLKGLRMFDGTLLRAHENHSGDLNSDSSHTLKQMILSDRALIIQDATFSEITRLSDRFIIGDRKLYVKMNYTQKRGMRPASFNNNDYLESFAGVKIESFHHFRQLVNSHYNYSKKTPLVTWSNIRSRETRYGHRRSDIAHSSEGVSITKPNELRSENTFLWIDEDRVKRKKKEALQLAEEKKLQAERIRLRLAKESNKKREWRDQLAPWGESIISHQRNKAQSKYQAHFVLYDLKSFLDSDGIWLKEDRDEVSFNRAKYGRSLVFVDQNRTITGSDGNPIHLKKGELVFVSEDQNLAYPIDDAVPLVKAILEDLPIQEFDPRKIAFFGELKWNTPVQANRSELPLYKAVRSRYRERNPQRWKREVVAIKDRIRSVGAKSPRAALRLYKQVLNEQSHLVTDAQSRLLFHLEFATDTLEIQTKPSISTDLHRAAATIGKPSDNKVQKATGTQSSWKIQILKGEIVFRSHRNSIISIDHPKVILDYLLNEEVPNWLVFPDQISDYGLALVSTISPADKKHSFSHIPPANNYDTAVLTAKREHEKVKDDVYRKPVLSGQDFNPMGNIVDFGLLCWGGATVLTNLEIGALKLVGYGEPEDDQGNPYEVVEETDITVLHAVRIREKVRIAHGELEGEVFQVKLSNKKTYWIARHERNSHTWAKKGWYVHTPPNEETDMRLNLRRNHESKRACLEYLIDVIDD